MIPDDHLLRAARRRFLVQSLHGAGAAALATLLDADGLRAAPAPAESAMTPRAPHFKATAKRCIYIYLEGGPSQMDLFDPKPKLNELDGQPLPESLLKTVRFAFIQKEAARLMGSPRKFAKHGQCGMDFSDLLPHLATCADDLAMIRSAHSDQFNHVPAQMLMNCGAAIPGRPSVGSWLTYGLGSESKNLPGYVSLVSVGRGLPGGSVSWSSGFLPSSYAWVLFRNGPAPVPHLDNPPGISPAMQESGVRAINDLNRLRHEEVGDPELASRMRAYELAFRMQTAAPELADLSSETKETLDLYGVNRPDAPGNGRGSGKGMFSTFARNCLLARRLVERGVRVVNLIHASWDHHSNLDPELACNAQLVDQPIAALLKDLKRRGMLEDTLVVWGSEFGRTPLGENRSGFKKVTGRDHHPYSFTTLMAGGGVKGGQIIGETDEVGWGVTRDPVHVHDLHATILHLFGLDHTKLTYRFQGREFRLTDVAGNVVKPLLK